MAKVEYTVGATFDPEEFGKREDARQKARKEIENQAVEHFGTNLGLPYVTYAHGRDRYSNNWREEQLQDRLSFTEAVVAALEAPTHQARVDGVLALLSAIDIKMERLGSMIERSPRY